MSKTDFFEDMDEESSIARPKHPIWALNLDNEENDKDILKWLTGEIGFLQEDSQDRLRITRRNLALYRGIHYESQQTRNSIRDNSVDKTRVVQKIVVNHLFDLAENRISKLVKYKPAVSVIPTNEEFEDMAASKATKALLDHIQYNNGFQSVLTPVVAKNMSVMGEAYLWIVWNTNKGDRHPLSKDGEYIPLLGEDGRPEKDATGKIIKIDKPVMTGDVEYEVVLSHDVFLQKAPQFSQVKYSFRRIIMPVEEARLRWPDKSKDIKESDAYKLDFDSLEMKHTTNEVVVWEFNHISTPQIPKGRQIFFTDKVILSNIKSPYSHGDHPFERITDIDLPGQVYGVSFFETIKSLTGTYNNITNMVLRNEYLVSHPKWMVPAGSINLSSLGNDITICQYKGQVAPVLVQANPTSPELFKMLDRTKEEFQQISGVFQISRGETPPGIKSGVALQFLHEQESERANTSILKWNEFIRKTAMKTISVAGDYYEADDSRTIRVLGKNNMWMTKFFDSSNLSKSYDIRVQNTSALPESKAARIQTIIDLGMSYPGIFTQEQIIDMLDLAQNTKFMSSATSAVRTAEAENESIIYDNDEVMPEEYEDHINHWNVHSRIIQEYHYKHNVPSKIKETMRAHILVHEMFMEQKSIKNNSFAEKLLSLSNYPLFYVTTPPEPTPAQQQQQKQQQTPMMSEGIQEVPQERVNPELGGQEQLGIQEEMGPIQVSGTEQIPEPGPITNI